MAQFRPMVITQKGQDLISEMLSGTGSIEFTKISLSDSEYTDEEIFNIVTLNGVKQSADISKITKTSSAAVKIEGAASNVNLTAGYYIKTIALYARNSSGGNEIVYAVCGASVPGWMPPYNGISSSGVYLKLITTVQNSENVELEIDPAAVATIGDVLNLQEQIDELNEFTGYAEKDVYGVEVDFTNMKFRRLGGAVGLQGGHDFDSINAFGGRKRCCIKNDGTVVGYENISGSYTTNGFMADSTTPVQVMVEQPKFYYKVVPVELEDITENGSVIGKVIKKARWYVSDKPKTGFKVHPAFVKSNGTERNFIYLSAYEACIFDTSANAYLTEDEQVADFDNDILSSISDVKPCSGVTQNLTRANTRKLAHNRGTGWEQMNIISASATQLLMLIEYASFDMQRNVGKGNCFKEWHGKNDAELTGTTNSLWNDSGEIVTTDGVSTISYRGEEGFWGDLWAFLDGANTQNPETFTAGMYGTLYVASGNYADDVFTGAYVNTGIKRVQGEGYISALGYSTKFDYLFVPSQHSGNSVFPVSDYDWNNYGGNRIALLGGSFSSGFWSGGFCFSSNDASADRNASVGGRSVYAEP